MAKGNLILGTAAKSIGDVVMYRRDGQQISRVRVRKIANPKTDAQCEQRAIMSAVVKFYQPFADVLQRSWQGLSTAKSYAKFLAANTKILKDSNLWYPKGIGAMPFKAKLSKGVLPAFGYDLSGDSISFNLGVLAQAPAMATMGDLSTFFISKGAKAGDIISILILKTTKGVVSAQFEVDTTSATTIAEGLNGINVVLNSYTEDEETSYTVDITPTFGEFAGGGIINSRWDGEKWLRSTSYAVFNAEIVMNYYGDEAKAAAIASYQGAATDGNPLVYLDGEELDNA